MAKRLQDIELENLDNASLYTDYALSLEVRHEAAYRFSRHTDAFRNLLMGHV